ncbi:MAG TPA: hypothetical protein VES89_06940 [Candidatus Competibacteraceae bacterium]|nr:hypothetical protein [Candidatus Competibacteraceae bacterium]
MSKSVGFYRLTLVLAASVLPACAELQDLQSQTESVAGQSAPASAPEEQGLSPVQRQLRTRADALSTPVWKTATFWQATALGTIAGAVIAGAQHEDTEGIIKSAAVGGSIGALVGAYIASKQQEYASHEAMLDSMIADVRLKNQQSEAFIESMKQVIAEDQTRLDQLEQQYKENRIIQGDLKRQQGIVEADRKKIKEAIQKAQEQLEVFARARMDYRDKNSGVTTTGLDQEIDSFQKKITVMNGIVKALSVPELG